MNHRQLLEAMFSASGIPSNLFKTVSSSVDKLDKQSWAVVREELIKEKGVDEPAVDALGEFVRIRGFQSNHKFNKIDFIFKTKILTGTILPYSSGSPKSPRKEQMQNLRRA